MALPEHRVSPDVQQATHPASSSPLSAPVPESMRLESELPSNGDPDSAPASAPELLPVVASIPRLEPELLVDPDPLPDCEDASAHSYGPVSLFSKLETAPPHPPAMAISAASAGPVRRLRSPTLRSCHGAGRGSRDHPALLRSP
jgi:hypothetical protein